MKFLLTKALLFSAVAATIFSSMTLAIAQDQKVDPNECLKYESQF